MVERRGLTAAAAIRIVAVEGSDVPLVGTSRTYNLTPEGTYGQFIGGVGEDKALIGYQPGTMMQLAHNEGFRTNMGFVSCVPFAIVVDVKLFAADGWALVTSPTMGSRYLAYAFVVDNHTGDPAFDPAALRTTCGGGRYNDERRCSGTPALFEPE